MAERPNDREPNDGATGVLARPPNPKAGYSRASSADFYRACSPASPTPESASYASPAVESPRPRIRVPQPRKDWQDGRGILQSFVDEPLPDPPPRPTRACIRYR